MNTVQKRKKKCVNVHRPKCPTKYYLILGHTITHNHKSQRKGVLGQIFRARWEALFNIQNTLGTNTIATPIVYLSEIVL
jgi:hypothetical protein